MHKFTSVSEYIASAPKPAQAMARKVRATIRAAAPKAEERMSYGIVGYFYNGRLVYFGAFKNHISFYGWGRVLRPLAKEMEKYKTSTGTLQFPIGSKVPVTLIRKIVRMRIRENEIRHPKY